MTEQTDPQGKRTTLYKGTLYKEGSLENKSAYNFC